MVSAALYGARTGARRVRFSVDPPHSWLSKGCAFLHERTHRILSYPLLCTLVPGIIRSMSTHFEELNSTEYCKAIYNPNIGEVLPSIRV